MEVVSPASSIMDFDFNSARSSPRCSPPSTPRRFGDYFFSAPTSPSRMSEFYGEFDRFRTMNDKHSSIGIGNSSLIAPFNREEKSNVRKKDDDDFSFDFRMEETSLPAEELFDGGKIKPSKPPLRFQSDEYNQKSTLLSPVRSPRSPFSQGKKMIREVFSPRKKKGNVDPFTKPIESDRGRGRERVEDLSSKNSNRRAIRSLSPNRVSEYAWPEEEEKQEEITTKHFSTSSTSKGSSRKWKLRDLLLFRSASEGHASDKDPFRKYWPSFSKRPEEIKKSTSRSSSGSGSSRRKASAHEIHYTTNKAVSDNMKKKTFLPYKQGILGRLAFNPAVHALSNGFGTITRS